MDEQQNPNPTAPETTPSEPVAPQQPQPEAPKAEHEAPKTEPQPQPQAHKQEQHIFIAALAYVLFFIPFLTEFHNDSFVKFHIKQGLVLFLACLASAVIIRMPVIGWILMGPLNIFLFVLWIMGIINALTGKQKQLPLIGVFGDKFTF